MASYKPPFVIYFTLDLMGIVIAIVYLPILALLSSAVWFLGKHLATEKDNFPLQSWSSRTIIILGAIFGVGVALWSASRVPHLDAQGFARLFWQIGLTLIVPIATGLTLILLSHFQVLRTAYQQLPVVLNRFGLGSLHAVWLLPSVLLVFALVFASICLEQQSAFYNPMLCK